MQIRRRNHPEGHIARGKNNPSPTRGARTKSGALRVHPRDKMGRVYSETYQVPNKETKVGFDTEVRKPWGALYNHAGEVIDPIAIQAKVNERTAMTASVQIGKSVTLERKFGGFVTVDATDAKAIMVWAHPKKSFDRKVAKPAILNNLKDVRRFVRALLDSTTLG